MRDRGGDRSRREWARMDEDEMNDVRRDAEPRVYGRDRGDFERQYGSGSGPEGYGGRDYAHTGAFTGSPADFSEPSGRHRARGPQYGSGSRGYGSYERTHRGEGRADERPRSTSFGDEPPSFGMGMQGNFGYDRGGEGAGGYFGGSDRGRTTTSGYAVGHGAGGGDVDRGFAGNSAGGTDRGYGGGFNYGWRGGAYRSFRGVGPRSYQRSDERVRELVSERLEDDHDVDASEIEVFVENGAVRLAGTVPDRRMKRLAEEVAESVRGVSEVRNELRVTR